MFHYRYCRFIGLDEYIYRKFLGILITFYFCLTASVAQQSTMQEMVQRMEAFVNGFPQTKIYVHTDKPFYSAGETIWYAIYAVNASDHFNLPLSELVYVTLEDKNDSLIVKQNLKLDGKFAHGDIALNSALATGNYILKAYSSYMRNFDEDLIFAKEIRIFSEEDSEIDLDEKPFLVDSKIRFFPEGGSLISGMNNKVAFEVHGTSPKEIEILNESMEVMAKGKVLQNGLGVFNIIPDADENYFVTLEGEKFTLPEVSSSGYGLTVNTFNKEKIYIDVASSADKVLDGAFIIGHIRGIPFLMKDDLQGDKESLVLQRNTVPEGVSQVTLFNGDGMPLAERTFFVRHEEDDINVNASIPYEYMNTRQITEVSVEIARTDDLRAKGSFSVSVVDSKKIQGIKEGVDIKSYLLLGSEFTKGIENIHQYLSENSTKSRYLLDVLMMTRGWTRFKWKDIREKKEPAIIYPPENGFTLAGRVFEKDKPIKASVNFSTVDKDLFFVNIDTDEEGRFKAFGFDLKKDEQLNISAFKKGKNDKQITKNIRLELDEIGDHDVQTTHVQKYRGPEREEVIEFLNTAAEARLLDSTYSAMQVELDEVVMTADRKLSLDKKIKEERGIIYTNYDKRVFMDSMPGRRMFTNVFDMVRGQVPGVQVVGTAGNQRFIVRQGSSSILGTSDALVIVDGSPVTYEYVNVIDPNQIEFIDVLKGMATSSLYGTPNGVVAIYTRTDNGDVRRNRETADNVVNVMYDGYFEVREFYSPDYGKSFPGAEKPDLRTTLYWNPRISFDEGKASLDFYSGDQTSEYLIEIQGLTEDGIPLVGYQNFEVR